MSVVVRGLVCAVLLGSSSVARAQAAVPKHAATPASAHPAAPHTASVAPAPTSAPPASAAPAAEAPAASAAPADDAAPADSATPDAAATPAPVAAPATVRVYMRAEPDPLSFSARVANSDGSPMWCVAPCDARLVPGDYELKLNGVFVDRSVALRDSGTLRGELHSHAGARAGAWLGLNVGGILGGVFITVAALGGPSWAYIAGGGSLAAGGVVFVVAYRADRATVSFTPGEPVDVRGMPPTQGPSAGGQASSASERGTPAAQARGLGFRLEF